MQLLLPMLNKDGSELRRKVNGEYSKRKPPVSEEARKKISLATKGKKKTPPSEEIRARLSLFRSEHMRSSKMRKVMSKAMKGRKFSEEHKKKIGAANKNPSEETREKMRIKTPEHWAKIAYANKHQSPETIAKRAATNKRRHAEKHAADPNWVPDGELEIIRTSLEYVEWRRAIFIQDHFRCQKCGQKGGEIHAHHIKSFKHWPKERFSLSNGVTLCKKCHVEFHVLYGLDKYNFIFNTIFLMRLLPL